MRKCLTGAGSYNLKGHTYGHCEADFWYKVKGKRPIIKQHYSCCFNNIRLFKDCDRIVYWMVLNIDVKLADRWMEWIGRFLSDPKRFTWSVRNDHFGNNRLRVVLNSEGFSLGRSRWYLHLFRYIYEAQPWIKSTMARELTDQEIWEELMKGNSSGKCTGHLTWYRYSCEATTDHRLVRKRILSENHVNTDSYYEKEKK